MASKIYGRYTVEDNVSGDVITARSISECAYRTAFFELSSVTVYGLVGCGVNTVVVQLAAYENGKEIWNRNDSDLVSLPIPKTFDQIRKATKPGAKRVFCDLAVRMGASVTR